jgi:hypothetical protein
VFDPGGWRLRRRVGAGSSVRGISRGDTPAQASLGAVGARRDLFRPWSCAAGRTVCRWAWCRFGRRRCAIRRPGVVRPRRAVRKTSPTSPGVSYTLGRVVHARACRMPPGKSHTAGRVPDSPACRTALGVSRRAGLAVGRRLGRVLGPLGVSGGFRHRQRPQDYAIQAIPGGLRRYGTPPGPYLGRGVRTFSVSRLQSEAAVDPHGNDGPSRPETTRAESVEPPYNDPVRERGRHNFSETSPTVRTWRWLRHVAVDTTRPTTIRRSQPVRPPCTVAIDEPYGASIPDRGDPGLLRPLLRDPPQQSADLGLAVAPMPSQRPD